MDELFEVNRSFTHFFPHLFLYGCGIVEQLVFAVSRDFWWLQVASFAIVASFPVGNASLFRAHKNINKGNKNSLYISL